MGRPKQYADAAARKAAQRARSNVTQPSNVTPDVTIPPSNVTLPSNVTGPSIVNQSVDNGFVRFRHQSHVPMSLFDGAGRGSPRTHTDGHAYVLVSRHAGSDLGELGIVSDHDWQGRLAQRCTHGLHGWSCHTC